jgi:glycosyltransferase involved in cell wall biosynthesis
MAQCIIALLDQDEHRKAMGRSARDRIRQQFSFENMSQRYHDLFQKLIT